MIAYFLGVNCSNNIHVFLITETTDFKQKSDEFILQMDELAKDVEREKMQTIGARNVFRSVAKQRETEKRKIQVKILKKEILFYNTITIPKNPKQILT